MKIEQINSGNKGCFKATGDGIEAGHMNYRWSGKDKIVVYHTKTNPDFAGKGVGKILVIEAVRAAREKHFKIIAECPFAKSVFDKTPEIRDVLATDED